MEKEIYQDIKQYLEGHLSPSAARAFEARLAGDADFAQELILYKGLLAASIQARQEERALEERLMERSLELLRQKSGEIPKADPEFTLDDVLPNPAKTLPLWKTTWGRLAIAASFALLIGVFWFLSGGRTDNPAALAAEYYERIKPAANLSGNGTLLDTINNLYSSKSYTTVFSYLDKLEQDTTYRNQASYWRGKCQYETKDFSGAIKSFEQVEKGSLLYSDSQKNIALAYLSLNEVVEARKQLNHISDDQDVNKHIKGQAGNILTRLGQYHD